MGITNLNGGVWGRRSAVSAKMITMRNVGPKAEAGGCLPSTVLLCVVYGVAVGVTAIGVLIGGDEEEQISCVASLITPFVIFNYCRPQRVTACFAVPLNFSLGLNSFAAV